MGDILDYERTVDAEPIWLEEAIDKYKDYIGEEVIIDAHYIRHLEGHSLADSADGKGIYLLLVGQGECEYYAHDGEYIFVPEGVRGTSALIRGTLHRGMYKLGGVGGGMLAEDITYLQIHTVVYSKSVVIER